MQNGDHPRVLIQDFAKQHPYHTLQFVAYKYVGTEETERKTIERSSAVLATGAAPSVPYDWDLAFEGMISDGAITMILPMMDFAATSLEAIQASTFCDVLHNLGLTEAHIFSSGRSFHAYVMKPVSKGVWIKFLGHALLCNKEGAPPVVDARWVGRKLLSGVPALRWTKNNDRYKDLPKYVGTVQPEDRKFPASERDYSW